MRSVLIVSRESSSSIVSQIYVSLREGLFAPAFLVALSDVSFSMLYNTYVYTVLRSQDNVATSYEYCAAKF